MSFWKKILYLVVVAGLSLALCEVLLRLFPRVQKKLPQSPQAEIPLLLPDPGLKYRPNPVFPGHDRLGFRNSAVPEEAAIVAIGDSQTYGVGVEREDAWPQQLQKIGGWSVYNMACGGWGPAQGLVLMEEAMKFKPKIIIQAFYAGNDLYDSFDLVYYLRQRLDLKTSDKNILDEIKSLGNAGPLRKRVNELSREIMIPKNKPLPPFETFLSENFKTYEFFREAKAKRENDRTCSEDDYWNLVNSEFSSRPEYRPFFLNASCRTVFTPEYRLCGLDLDDVRISEGFRISLEALRLMNERAEAGKTDFLVLLIPTKEFVFKNAVEQKESLGSGAYEKLVENEEKLWMETKDFLNSRGIVFLDALPALRKCLEEGRQPYPITWNGHPNKTGQEAIAQLVSDEIRKRNLMLPKENKEAA